MTNSWQCNSCTHRRYCTWIVEAIDKKRARLNCIHHLLSLIPCEEVQHPRVTLPERVHNRDYLREPIPKELYVPSVY